MMPRILLMLLFLLSGVPWLVEISSPGWGQWGGLCTLLVLIISLLDLVLSPSLKNIEVQREASEVVSVGARNPVRIWLVNHNRGTVSVIVHDEPPQPCSMEELPATLVVPSSRTRYVTYHVEPQQRGKNRFGHVFLRSKSRLGLWTLQAERDLTQDVQVYPDIQAVHGVELLARLNRLAEAGVRMSRLRGRGNEFERLREYRREDEYRNIDWKATARHQSLISREYVVEKNQNILFILDCGRSMCNEADGITHFDRALNAAILLSFVALRQGDTVGMLACSHKVERWVPPLRGAGSIQRLIRQVYDIHAKYEASDYEMMVDQLMQRHRKRSLVILLSHVLDELHLETIGEQLRRLKSRHLVIGAFLKNVPLQERMETIPQTTLEAFQVASAAEMVGLQTLQIAQLEQKGLYVLDTLPEELSAGLVSQYLEIKARHLL